MKKEEERQLLKGEKKEQSKIKRQKSKVERAKEKSGEVLNEDEPKERKSAVHDTKDNNTDNLKSTKKSKEEDNDGAKEDSKNVKERNQVGTTSKVPQEAKKSDKVAPVKKKRLIFSFRRTKEKSSPVSSPTRQKLNAKPPSVEESAM